MFLAARERVKVFDSYPEWILWLVDARLLPVPVPPPPLEVTRRLEDRLSLGAPAELGRELEAMALLEELPYLEELRSLSESPCCEIRATNTIESSEGFAYFGLTGQNRNHTLIKRSLKPVSKRNLNRENQIGHGKEKAKCGKTSKVKGFLRK